MSRQIGAGAVESGETDYKMVKKRAYIQKEDKLPLLKGIFKKRIEEELKIVNKLGKKRSQKPNVVVSLRRK